MAGDKTLWDLPARATPAQTDRLGVDFSGDPSDATSHLTMAQVTTEVIANAGFTSQSVLYGGASGEITEDNANFKWDDSAKELFVQGDYQSRDGEFFIIHALNTSGTKSCQLNSILTGVVPASEHSTTELRGLTQGSEKLFLEYIGAQDDISIHSTTQHYKTGTQTNKPIYESTLDTNGIIHFQEQHTAHNSIAALHEYSRIDALIGSNTSGAESGKLGFSVSVGGSLEEFVTVDGDLELITLNAELFAAKAVRFKRTPTAVSANAGDEFFIGVTDTSVPRTITLPSPEEGRMYVVKDESGGAGTNNITVTVTGGGTIDAAASIPITANHAALRVYGGVGTAWFTW